MIEEKILDDVCETFGMTKNLLRSKFRQREIIDARQTAVLALRKLGFTQQFISEQLNYADHTTVNHLINKRLYNHAKNDRIATEIVNRHKHTPSAI